jgi:hypothetical protein
MRKHRLTWSALCLLLAAIVFAGCDSGPAATPTPVVDNTPGVNITQADYDAALAKWEALNVQEYNENVTYDAFAITRGTWDLHVTTSAIEPVSFSQNGTPATPPTIEGDAFRLLTVDGMFNNVARALADQSSQDYQFRYEVRFDPEKGYPTFFSARSVPNPETNSGVLADADYTITVHSLEVVK